MASLQKTQQAHENAMRWLVSVTNASRDILSLRMQLSCQRRERSLYQPSLCCWVLVKSCTSRRSCRSCGGHVGKAGQESPEPLGSVHFNALYGELRTSDSPVRKVSIARSSRNESPSRLGLQPEKTAERSAADESRRCGFSFSPGVCTFVKLTASWHMSQPYPLAWFLVQQWP